MCIYNVHMCDLSHDPPNGCSQKSTKGRASADGSVQGRSSESEASCREGNQWNLPSGDFIVI